MIKETKLEQANRLVVKMFGIFAKKDSGEALRKRVLFDVRKTVRIPDEVLLEMVNEEYKKYQV